MKVLLVIRSLNVGGAERQAITTAKTLTAHGNTVHIAIFESGGSLESELLGHPSIQVHVLKRSRLIGLPLLALQIRKLVSQHSYDALYGFLPIPNMTLVGSRMKKNRPRIVWGVRSSNLDLTQYSRKVRWSMKLERFMSRWADAIVSNSTAAREEYIGLGYDPEKFSVIPNMIDVQRFRPRPEVREKCLSELGIPSSAKTIGIFARIHHKKDHTTFLRAAGIALEKDPNLRFLCVGGHALSDANYINDQKTLAKELGITSNVHWLGERTDPETLMNACTITTLTSSSGEGFPNSVAESLACGIPCVATDSGEARLIIDHDPYVVAPKNSDALAKAWISLLSMTDDDRSSLSRDLRSSIVDRFSPAAIAEKISATLKAS